MTTLFDVQLRQDVVNLLPGEFGASGTKVFSTVLGSCVAVVVFDPVNRVGGMNHFLLPGSIKEGSFYKTESGRYGMFAMELLINAVIKQGGDRRAFVAKVFGGGSVLRTHGFTSDVPESNIRFAFDYLDAEKIPIASTHVGGTFGRKVYLFSDSGRVFVRRIVKESIVPIETEEMKFLEKTRREIAAPEKRLTLF